MTKLTKPRKKEIQEEETNNEVVKVVVKEKKKLTEPTCVVEGKKTYGTGRRKTSIARVWIKSGMGKITVNKLSIEKYFSRDAHKAIIIEPFIATNTFGQFDVICTVKGGGLSGQTGAIRLGIARALDEFDETLHTVLHHRKFLTRDPRAVERKKYGQHKARKKTQFSKR